MTPRHVHHLQAPIYVWKVKIWSAAPFPPKQPSPTQIYLKPRASCFRGQSLETLRPKCRAQVRENSHCWRLFLSISQDTRRGTPDHINDVPPHSCHLIATTLCLAQKSLIWIPLCWNHIHIYNVGQLQLNPKLHCGKLCQSTVQALLWSYSALFFLPAAWICVCWQETLLRVSFLSCALTPMVGD